MQHDLIFYKSSLNMPFVRNDIGDPYHLNEGKNIGSVAPSTFTVQPQPQFIITAQMQREGDGDINEDVTISSVDREQHIINMVVKGCPDMAICSPQNNPDIYEQIKTILVGAVLKAPQQNFREIGQNS